MTYISTGVILSLSTAATISGIALFSSLRSLDSDIVDRFVLAKAVFFTEIVSLGLDGGSSELLRALACAEGRSGRPPQLGSLVRCRRQRKEPGWLVGAHKQGTAADAWRTVLQLPRLLAPITLRMTSRCRRHRKEPSWLVGAHKHGAMFVLEEDSLGPEAEAAKYLSRKYIHKVRVICNVHISWIIIIDTAVKESTNPLRHYQNLSTSSRSPLQNRTSRSYGCT